MKSLFLKKKITGGKFISPPFSLFFHFIILSKKQLTMEKESKIIFGRSKSSFILIDYHYSIWRCCYPVRLFI